MRYCEFACRPQTLNALDERTLTRQTRSLIDPAKPVQPVRTVSSSSASGSGDYRNASKRQNDAPQSVQAVGMRRPGAGHTFDPPGVPTLLEFGVG